MKKEEEELKLQVGIDFHVWSKGYDFTPEMRQAFLFIWMSGAQSAISAINKLKK